MPVRSLTSSVLKWPDARAVDAGVRQWAKTLAVRHTDVIRIGYLGSYARGDWGVGSDVDILIILDRSDKAFHERALDFDATTLPVPADLLIYTQAELNALCASQSRFAKTLNSEPVWVFDRPTQPQG